MMTAISLLVTTLLSMGYKTSYLLKGVVITLKKNVGIVHLTVR
jgi:hypothetical protein